MTTSRSEQKQLTRQALLTAGLELSSPSGLTTVSLRQVAKAAGIVPTAFYRHFDSLEELGLELVSASFRTLRTMIRALHSQASSTSDLIATSVATVVEYVGQHQAHFGFIIREEATGFTQVRQAISHELALIERELATDLARLLPTWPTEQLGMLAHLVVAIIVTLVREIIAAPGDDFSDAASAAAAVDRARQQLELIALGARRWNPHDSSLGSSI